MVDKLELLKIIGRTVYDCEVMIQDKTDMDCLLEIMDDPSVSICPLCEGVFTDGTKRCCGGNTLNVKQLLLGG